MFNKFINLTSLLFFLLNSCIIEKPRTGFLYELPLNHSKERVFSLKTVKIINQLNTSGWFLTLSDDKKKSLSLFIPASNKKKINIKKIINKIERSNNPNDWPFYYCINGSIYLDSVFNKEGEKLNYNIYETINHQNKLNMQNLKNLNGYNVKYVYVDSVGFCVANVLINELNTYNSKYKFDDGMKTKNELQNSFYYFNENDQRMNILLVKSSFCD